VQSVASSGGTNTEIVGVVAEGTATSSTGVKGGGSLTGREGGGDADADCG
jgi:hypothetical protein